jgi:hypothetical protein
MEYAAELIRRDDGDRIGEGMCSAIAAALSRFASKGLSQLILIPIQDRGNTAGVVVVGGGPRSNAFSGEQSFVKLTGLATSSEIADFLGVEHEWVERHSDSSRERGNSTTQMKESSKGRDNYIAEVLQRDEGDNSADKLGQLIAMYLTCLSNNGLDRFVLVPIENDGRTVSVIAAARGIHPKNQQAPIESPPP